MRNELGAISAILSLLHLIPEISQPPVQIESAECKPECLVIKSKHLTFVFLDS
jgi:hypothetical protein